MRDALARAAAAYGPVHDWSLPTGLALAALVALAVVAAILATRRPRRPSWSPTTRRLTAVVAGATLPVALMGASIDPGPDVPPPALRIAVTLQAADSAALDAMMRQYDPGTGLWPTPVAAWWGSAINLTAMIDAERALGTHRYDAAIGNTFARAIGTRGPGFVGDYFDDAGWWGLAWLDAYRWTGDRRSLAAAEQVDAAMAAGWSPGCGGGIDWAKPVIRDFAQKNAITNGLFLALSAGLARATGQAAYVGRARTEWAWLRVSHLLGANHLIWDHLDASCGPVGARWSYTQGVLLAGLADLSAATGDPAPLAAARVIGDATVTEGMLNPGGVLTDPCEVFADCATDALFFKGPAAAGIAQLDAALPGHPYRAWLRRQAAAMLDRDRAVGDLYGPHWAGPLTPPTTGTQASALALLTAAGSA